jgi:hypothetical protein
VQNLPAARGAPTQELPTFSDDRACDPDLTGSFAWHATRDGTVAWRIRPPATSHDRPRTRPCIESSWIIWRPFARRRRGRATDVACRGSSSRPPSRVALRRAPPKPGRRREFREFLGCGVLARGFARFRCDDCGLRCQRRGAASLSTGGLTLTAGVGEWRRCRRNPGKPFDSQQAVVIRWPGIVDVWAGSGFRGSCELCPCSWCPCQCPRVHGPWRSSASRVVVP